MKLWIRPVFVGPCYSNLALCRSAGALLVDEDILAHYPADVHGAEVRENALEGYGVAAENVAWGPPINNDWATGWPI